MMKNKTFNRDENGSITLFIVLMFTIMVLGSGMAIDFMRYESERASLQDAIDRGVLSAASLRRTGDHAEAEAIVDSYLLSNSIGLKSVSTTITTDLAMNSRRVNISADYTINTIFLKLAGITTLSVNAQASAEETRSDIEISMVLDVTGSMGGAKIDNLKVASNTFVDLILTPETVDRTTISVVPFLSQTRISGDFAAQYNLNDMSSNSTCVSFDTNDFNTTDIDPVDTYDTFSTSSRCVDAELVNRWGDNIDLSYLDVLPLSNSPVILHAKIDSLLARGGTNTADGMMWGAALLDPLTQPVVASLSAIVDVDNGGFLVDPAFADRPATFDDSETMKFIILMTDGGNGNATVNDARTLAVCSAAKDNDVIIYSIAYALDPNIAWHVGPIALMQACATSPAKYYNAETLDLEETFRQIAQSIQKLRLVN